MDITMKNIMRWMVPAILTLSTVAADEASPIRSRHDQLKIAAQKICPVMGEPLGSMGPPVKVKIGQQELFLCCEACRSKSVDRNHWATIHANLRDAQGTCPVMGSPLPPNSRYTIVKGQLIYTCCPPCIEKIQADPNRWLKQLDDQYAANLAAPRSPDEIKIAVQKICPVMGKPLGSMGRPIAVNVGGQKLFLCCEACRKKQIDPTHWATIHRNFANAQGICPIMEKPIPSGAKWTVANGNLIFVCCPPCIEEIQKQPEAHSKRLMECYAKYVVKVADVTERDRAMKRNSQQ